MSNELIVVKQLPVIEERLQSISEAIQEQTSKVLALAVTEDTVKEIKKRRTELNKNFRALEDQRKAVKASVMAPYEAFEEIYKRYVTDIFKPADTKLKARIDEVEATLLRSKKADVESYFKEVAEERDIDFAGFDALGIKVLFSDSMKKLKEQVDDALSKITGELAVISTMDHADEILVEYKENLNLTDSVLMVKRRKERLAAELQRRQEQQRPAPEPAAPVIEAPEPAVISETVCAEPVPDTEPVNEQAAAQPVITIIIKAHSAEEVMAVTELCRLRRLFYTIS